MLTEAPTAPPDEDVELEEVEPVSSAFCVAIAPDIRMLEIPSFIAEYSFKTSKPVSESTPI